MNKYKNIIIFRFFVLMVLPMTASFGVFLVISGNQRYLSNYTLMLLAVGIFFSVLLSDVGDDLFESEFELKSDANPKYSEQIHKFHSLIMTNAQKNEKLMKKNLSLRRDFNRLFQMKKEKMAKIDLLTHKKNCVVENIEGLLDLSDKVFTVIDTAGNIVYANSKFYIYTGLKKGDDINKLFFFHDDNGNMMVNHMFLDKLTNLENTRPVIVPFTFPKEVELQKISSNYVGFGLFLLQCVSVNDEITKKSSDLLKNREIDYINRINQMLTISKETDGMMQNIVRSIRKFFKVKHIMILSKEEREWVSYDRKTPLPDYLHEALDGIQVHEIIQRTSLGTRGEMVLANLFEAEQEKIYLAMVPRVEVSRDDMLVIRMFIQQMRVVIYRSKSFECLKCHFLKTMDSLIRINEENLGMKGHFKRVAGYVRELADYFQLRLESIEPFFVGSKAYDVRNIVLINDLEVLCFLFSVISSDVMPDDMDMKSELNMVSFEERIMGALVHEKRRYIDKYSDNVKMAVDFEDIVSVAGVFDCVFQQKGLEEARARLICQRGIAFSPIVVDRLLETVDQRVVEEG